jgi:hypothetical protein
MMKPNTLLAGFDGPKGMGIRNGKLYVADIMLVTCMY